MNRLKIALYTAVVVVVCAVNAVVVPRGWVARELSRLDVQLQNAGADLSGRAARTTANEALDAGSVASVRASYGVDVTVAENGKPVRSALPAADAARAVKVAPPSGRAVGAGDMAGVVLSPGLPALPLLFVSAPAYRVRTATIPSGPVTILSAATTPALTPIVAYQWTAVLATLVLLVLGLLATFTVTNEASPVVPKELVGVADRLSRGDFSARAPSLAGSLGILSTGMNRAAEAAESAGRAPVSSLGDDPFATAIGPPPAPLLASEPEPAPRPEPVAEAPAGAGDFAESFGASLPPAETPPEPPVEPPGASTLNLPSAPPAAEQTSPLGLVSAGAPSEPAPESAPAFFSPPASEPASAHQTTAMPLTLEPPDGGTAEEPRSADEEHWRTVYDDFVRVRTQCGEPATVPYERFRQKLEKNRDQLVSKYACRTVRFQVYVKEGKAALKASPVR